ncbi:hypothetical protein FACS1894176_06180 [Bacteroidia bacterium]|nr:hypothetical protein FACS1894176_06180 [Bacteroidia bacterium]
MQGKTIPAESVYRDIGVLNAGETRMLSFTINAPCDTMNGTKYALQSTIEGTLSDPHTSAFIETTLIAQARPQIRKTASGAFNYAQTNYLYLPYNSTLTYTISASNPYGTEPINKPVVTDDLSDISQKLLTACGGASLVDRVSAISDGGVLSGTQIIWNLANIGRNQTKNLTYKVDFS